MALAGRMRVADYIMAWLAEHGVRDLFMLPGGGAMHLNDALAQSGLGWVACNHEQACGIAAEAYGRMRGGLGVCMVTTGPGATNGVTPVAGAWIESVPMLVLSGQVKRADLVRSSGVRQKGVQEVDIVSMVRGVTKYAVTVEDPLTIREHLERAAHAALSGRQGPAWLDIPLDVQAATVDAAELRGWSPAEPPKSNIPVPDVLDALSRAHRPLVLAGHGVRLSGAAAEFTAFCERTGVPVVTTWNALDLLPHAHPLLVGRPGVVALRAPNFAVQNCDLLISIGCRLDNVVTAYSPATFAPGAVKVVVDVDEAELRKLDMRVALPVVADARSFLGEMNAALGNWSAPDWQAWRDRCSAWKARYAWRPGGDPGSSPLGHFEFAERLSDALPENTVVATGSSGLGIEAFYTVFRNKPGQRVFLTSGLGAMGYGVPAAVGACVATRRSPMVLVESDGSLQLNVQELATIRANDLPICIFVLNNGGYASIRNTQRNYFKGRFIGTGKEAGLLVPDSLELARAYGIPGTRIKDRDGIAAALATALAAPRPFICDVVLDPDEVLAPKVSAIPQPDGSMMSMPLEDMSPLLGIDELRENVSVVHPASLKARGLQT